MATFEKNELGQSLYATEFFTYNVNFTTLLHNTTQTTNLQIAQESSFEIQKLSYYATSSLTSAPEKSTTGFLSVLMTDLGSGRQMSDISMPVDSIFGNGQLPFILPNTKILAAKSSLNVQITNFSSSVDYSTIYLSFIGRKLYYR